MSAFPNLENKGIGNIARDENGRMWITTNNSVFSFSPDSLGNPEHINTCIISGRHAVVHSSTETLRRRSITDALLSEDRMG